jgi:hypothetical protein
MNVITIEFSPDEAKKLLKLLKQQGQVEPAWLDQAARFEQAIEEEEES